MFASASVSILWLAGALVFVFAMVVVVAQHLEISRFKKRARFLNQSRAEWVNRYLKLEKDQVLTTDLCNLALAKAIEYKKELGLLERSLKEKEKELKALSLKLKDGDWKGEVG